MEEPTEGKKKKHKGNSTKEKNSNFLSQVSTSLKKKKAKWDLQKAFNNRLGFYWFYQSPPNPEVGLLVKV
jgi:hypothetical protein